MIYRSAIIFATTAILGVLGSYGSEEKCEARAYAEYMNGYMERVGGSIKALADKVTTGKFKFLESMNKKYAVAFEKAGCPDLWKPEFTLEDRDATLDQLMEGLDPEPNKNAIEIIKNLDGVLWHLSQDHILFSCMHTITRSYCLEQVHKCTGDGYLPFAEDELVPIDAPNVAVDEEFGKNYRAALKMMVWAHMRAQNCAKGDEALLKAFNTITKAGEENYCYAGSDSFDSDACYAKFRANCTKIIPCMLHVGMNVQTHAVDLFIKQNRRFIRCIKDSDKYWSKVGRPAGLDSAGLIVARSLPYWEAISKVDLSDEEKKEARHYLNGMTMLSLRTNTCHCEVPIPPIDDEVES